MQLLSIMKGNRTGKKVAFTFSRAKHAFSLLLVDKSIQHFDPEFIALLLIVGGCILMVNLVVRIFIQITESMFELINWFLVIFLGTILVLLLYNFLTTQL